MPDLSTALANSNLLNGPNAPLQATAAGKSLALHHTPHPPTHTRLMHQPHTNALSHPSTCCETHNYGVCPGMYVHM